MNGRLVQSLIIFISFISLGFAWDEGKPLARPLGEESDDFGCNYGTFSRAENDQVDTCRGSLQSAEVPPGQTGLAIRLEYNVGNQGALNGLFIKMGPEDKGNNFDAAIYHKLTFWLKGDERSGIPAKLKLELKGDPETAVGATYVDQISAMWKKFEIPLDEFVKDGNIDLTRVNEIRVVFEHKSVGLATRGAIFIDDITLEK